MGHRYSIMYHDSGILRTLHTSGWGMVDCMVDYGFNGHTRPIYREDAAHLLREARASEHATIVRWY